MHSVLHHDYYCMTYRINSTWHGWYWPVVLLLTFIVCISEEAKHQVDTFREAIKQGCPKSVFKGRCPASFRSFLDRSLAVLWRTLRLWGGSSVSCIRTERSKIGRKKDPWCLEFDTSLLEGQTPAKVLTLWILFKLLKDAIAFQHFSTTVFSPFQFRIYDQIYVNLCPSLFWMLEFLQQPSLWRELMSHSWTTVWEAVFLY